MKMTSRSLLLLALGVAACGGDSSGPNKAGPPASLAVVSGSGQTGESGQLLANALTVKVSDAKGNAVAKAVVNFSVASGGGTLSATADTTDADGIASVQWTLGGDLGDARVEARVASVTAPAVFTATVKAGAPTALLQVSDAIGNTAAGFDLYDSVAVRVTDKFSHPVANAPVTFAVTSGGGTVSAASKTTGDDGIARTAWTMGTSGVQSLRITSGSIETTLNGNAASCSETSLAVGQAISVAPVNLPCLVVTGSAQRYIISVTNPTATPASYAAFRVRGASSTVSGNTTGSVVTPVSAQAALTSSAVSSDIQRMDTEARVHRNVMQANYAVMDRLRGANVSAGIHAQDMMLTLGPPALGDIVSLKIPKNFAGDLCDNSDSTNPDKGSAKVGARVVYITTHAVILEDTANPVKSTFDPYYQQLGDEFENTMWSILTTNYGNPLAMDSRLNNTGKVYMVFSKTVNALQGGSLAGFVSSTDFYPTSMCASSNQQATFYARVPTNTGSGFDSDNTTQTPDEWLRSIRTVVIHEMKHVTSFAEKFSRNNGFYPGGGFGSRDQWLEESSAMLAEELWARTVFGYSQFGNTTYANSLYCEVRPRPTSPECQPGGSKNPSSTVRPTSLVDHYFYLYDYENDPENLSIVGPVGNGDFTFYGAGWMFLRWLIDQYAPNEPTYLSAMATDYTRGGVTNIESMSGKSFPDLLGEFSLALALDDQPGFTPQNPKLSEPSWNIPDIFVGLNHDFSGQNFFTKAAPLSLHPAGFGRFAIDVSSVHGGGMSFTQVTGTQSAKQLFEFKGASGTAFPAEMRINVVRVQ